MNNITWLKDTQTQEIVAGKKGPVKIVVKVNQKIKLGDYIKHAKVNQWVKVDIDL